MPTHEEPAPPLRDAVTTTMRRRIITGDLPPGSRLVERQLAEQLGVSRVPVREALRTLQREGLIEERATRGMIVRRLSDDDVAMLFDIRASLEDVLCRRLVDVIGGPGLDDLEAAVARAQQHARAGRADEAVRENADFHSLLIEHADSEVLRQIIEPVASRLTWLLNQHTDPVAMAADHGAIVAALRSGDVDAALAAFRAHLDRSRAAASQTRGA